MSDGVRAVEVENVSVIVLSYQIRYYMYIQIFLKWRKNIYRETSAINNEEAWLV